MPSNVDGGSAGREMYDESNFLYDWLPSAAESYSTYYGVGGAQLPVQETQSEGQELYLHFFHEQLRSAGLSEIAATEEQRLARYHDSSAHLDVDSSTTRNRADSMNLENFQNPVWRAAGRDLKMLADQFAQSREREAVRRRAESVDVTSLDMQQFMELLKELFQGGQITRERILVLFFFCSDLSIMAVRCQLNGMLAKLTQWTLLFIRNKVCAWVHQNGGWQSVFNSGVNLVQQMAVIGMCSAVMIACFFYIRKSLNK